MTRRWKRTIRRWTAALSAGALGAVLFSWPVYADTSTNVTASHSYTQPIIINQTMKNGVPMIATPAPHAPQIVSQAAVVMDLNTGTIVYAKNPQVEHYPASLTKIMTALIALQKGKLTDELTTSKLATQQPPDKLYLVPGEQEALKKLLYGMLLNSANDAAVVIAQHYGGSISGFAKLMNQKAKSLGATHTHFMNPSGLPNSQHVTTAYDMALIARAAMQIPLFRKIVQTRHYQWVGEKWHRDLVNINPMLFSYPGAIGVKTGFTNVAHETLAVAAKHGNETFLAVLLDAPTNREIDNDATKLLNYAFKNYTTEHLVSKGTVVSQLSLSSKDKPVPIRASKTMLATVLKNDPIYSSKRVVFSPNMGNSRSGTSEFGSLEFLHGNSVVASDPLVLPPHALPKQAARSTGKRGHSWVWISLSVAGLIVLGALRRRQVRRRRYRYGNSIRSRYYNR